MEEKGKVGWMEGGVEEKEKEGWMEEGGDKSAVRKEKW